MAFPGKKSVIFFILGFFAAWLLLFIAGWAYFYFGFLQKIDLGAKTIAIEIKQGETLSDLAQKLWQEGIIKSQLLFKLAVRNDNFEKGLQIGLYTFSGKLNGFDVLKILKSQPDISITFPEGKTIEEMADILDKNKIVARDDFLSAVNNFDATEILGFQPAGGLEGYLFPDTYKFRTGQKPEAVIKTLLQNFKNKVLISLKNKLLNAQYKLTDIVKLASIIEKEVIGIEDKKVVSGILQQRLKNNYLLQADSTLNYILKTNRNSLNADELKIDSPYNTYKYKGLPPTPISNPGLESILAALEPIETDYYFYLTDKSGKAHFAKTYEEHQLNIKKYLRP